jgi:hypothetical protein
MSSKNPKLQQLENLIRKEIENILRENKIKFKKKRMKMKELTQPEKDASLKAKQADIQAKTIALKYSQDELNKLTATPVDQK